MATRSIRIIMEGATGRLGATHHLRSLMAMRQEGGVVLANGDRLMPEPILLGRNQEKLAALASRNGNLAWSTDRAACLGDQETAVYFDASITAGRAQRAREAITAGKHIYLEKPIAETLDEALTLVGAAAQAGLANGVVQDKLFLPGFAKMTRVVRSGQLGRILAARLDFGWWIFDGISAPAQRPSWNYRKSMGGGLVLDMFPHWRYILDQLVGEIAAVSCRLATATPERRDEAGLRFPVDVEDTALATLQTEGGALVQLTCSWATRVKRDDLVVLQVDGAEASAVCGLHRCFTQAHDATPRPLWNIEKERDEDFDRQWQEVVDPGPWRNPYAVGWELFLRHVTEGAPFPAPLLAGAKGLQLIEACYRSDRERRWIDLPRLHVQNNQRGAEN
jgi:predicted dehydrogenase